MAFVSGFKVGGGRRACAKQSSSRRTALRMSESNLCDFTKVDFKESSEFEGKIFKTDTVDFPATRVKLDHKEELSYKKECEEAINTQINVELTASYLYQAMYAYFCRDTVGLPGFAKYFKDMSVEEKEHAEKLIEYQNARGGRVVFKPLYVPEIAFDYYDGTSDALYAMDLHLQIEKFVYEKVMAVHEAAEKAHDPQLQDYMETFLSDQVEAIKVAADYVAQIRRVGTGHGVYHIDTALLEGNIIPKPDFALA
ncbi:hypothetical protein NDN08_001387 [Rhodosorus marinus]|uniref:Ferritin n=1 Tax=Rhodosorus marinus TaxID=101924 RepID=A0AAV8UTG1_9RHOD|nr:hypothetical protein NDN08_001387 [Rhodosorus marinus]